MCGADALEELHRAESEAKSAAVAARAPFQWVDGPLVTAMRNGDIILIDELNLAEDAVLERMNRCVGHCGIDVIIHLLGDVVG